MARSVPLSVRVSPEDAAFLSNYEAPDAKTPSDKIRAILAAERRREAGAHDFGACVEIVEAMLRPARRRLRNARKDAGIRSDFVTKMYEKMPEILATMMITPESWEGGRNDLEALESELAEITFALIEEILELGLLKRGRTYDSDLVRDRIPPILEIVELIALSDKSDLGK